MNLEQINSGNSPYSPVLYKPPEITASIPDKPSSQNAQKLQIDAFNKPLEIVSSNAQTETFVHSKEKASELKTIHADVSLDIPGVKPRKQKFKISYNETTAYFDNAEDTAVYGLHSPRIIISLTLDSPTTKLEVKNFQILPPADTVEGEILYTRYMFALNKANKCSLKLSSEMEDVEFIDIVIEPIPESEMRQLISRAKLCRKLLYIERVFGHKFLLPQNISPIQVQITDIIFRGIAEGVFTIRGRDIGFGNVLPSHIDITKPPFTGLGSFSHSVAGEKTGEERVELFGHWLETGPIIVSINNAELASRKILAQIRTGATEPLSIKFAVLDNKIIPRFERYAPKSHKERKALQERLERFKASLYSEEPKELVDLIDEPLAENVSANEAVEIVSGWLQYNRLPDRFCPQDPKLEADGKHWRVPLWIVYASGKGDLVEDILVNAQTGEIVNQPSIEELRKKGLEIASKLLHAG